MTHQSLPKSMKMPSILFIERNELFFKILLREDMCKGKQKVL